MLFSKEIKLPQNSSEQLNEANEILKTLSPIVQNMYKNKAVQMIGAGFDVIVEYLFYIIGIACFGFAFIMNTVFPFHVLGEIVNNKAYETAISNKGDMETFNLAVKGLVIIIGILFIIIGFARNTARKRNALLHQAGSELKNIEAIFINKKQFLDSSIPKTTSDELKVVEPKAFGDLK